MVPGDTVSQPHLEPREALLLSTTAFLLTHSVVSFNRTESCSRGCIDISALEAHITSSQRLHTGSNTVGEPVPIFFLFF